jgi:hypothetical protein
MHALLLDRPTYCDPHRLISHSECGTDAVASVPWMVSLDDNGQEQMDNGSHRRGHRKRKVSSRPFRPWSRSDL